MKAPLNIHQTVVKFFEPLNKHPFWTVSASVIIGLALYACVDIVLAEVNRQNSYPIQMLATELLIEHGPNYVDETKRYEDIIDQYIEYIEQRKYASILNILYPTLSPQKALASIREELEKVTDEQKAEKALWQAGIKINQLNIQSERFPRSPIAWLKSEDLPPSLLRKLDNAFDTFHKIVNNLENTQTQKAAVDECRHACRYSRNVLLLLTLGRLGYDDEERIERFLSDIKRARDLALLFAEKYKSEQQVFYDRAQNMNLRIQVVEAILVNDMDRVSHLLREVIEKAFEKEKGNATE